DQGGAALMRIRWNLKKTLICGLLLYLLTLIWTLPAAVGWKQLQPRRPVPVTIHGLAGTLWSGQAGQLVGDGINQGRLDWRSRPGMRLSGAIGLELQWQPRNGQVLGQVRIRPGALSLQDIRGELDASRMAMIPQ